jgi:sensor c-di-GMP phosphodiesterase-like protein
LGPGSIRGFFLLYAMRKYITYALIAALMLAAILVPPWLAWKEADLQAFDIESGLALAYARDVLHRADTAASQSRRRLAQLRDSGYPPCSPESMALMREFDLATTYIQAIGYVRKGVMVCSSLGTDAIPLGAGAYRTSNGYTIYPDVPLAGAAPSPLLAIESGGYAVLIHRDQPVDTSMTDSDVSLGLFHTEHKQNIIARGVIDPAWIAHLGKRGAASFIAGSHLVAIIRSDQTLAAAIAALPLRYVQQRTAAIAWRLMPAAALGGLLIAALVFLAWRSRTSIDTALRQALRRNELFLLYQPIVDLASDRVVGVEALLRWRRASGEEVGPDLFIPVAEQSGLIHEVTDRVLHLIARDTDGYLAGHPEFHVAINLSPADIQSPAIVGKIERLIAHCRASPSNFILEITERGFLDLDAARAVLHELRERAIEVAIDDFGTGYSSLSYIESLHIDYLKIDRSFIEAIGTGAPTSQVVGHIIEMARTMRLRMIAEGIESTAQAEFVRSRHVQFAQGWSFGKPMPFADVLRHVRDISRAPYPAPS